MDKLSIKINKFYLNKIIKNEKVFIKKVDNKILLSDSYSISIVDDKDFIYNSELFKEVSLDSFIDKLQVEDYQVIDSWYVLENKVVVLKYRGLDVLIDKKYMSLFFDKNIIIKIIGDNKPVLFYEGSIIRGFVLPIKKY